MNDQQRDALRRLLWRAKRTLMEERPGNYQPTRRLNTYTFLIDNTFWVPMTHEAKVVVYGFSNNWWAAHKWKINVYKTDGAFVEYIATLPEPESYEQIKNWVRMVTALQD